MKFLLKKIGSAQESSKPMSSASDIMKVDNTYSALPADDSLYRMKSKANDSMLVSNETNLNQYEIAYQCHCPSSNTKTIEIAFRPSAEFDPCVCETESCSCACLFLGGLILGSIVGYYAIKLVNSSSCS